MTKVPRAIYVIGIICVLAVSLVLASCGDTTTSEDTGSEKVLVVTSSFPLYDFARIIGGEQAEVVLLTPPGLSPHSFEPTPKHIETIESADMFIYSGAGLEPWVEDVLAGIENRELLVINAADGVTLMEIGEHDAHDEHDTHEGHEHDMHVEEGDDIAPDAHDDEMEEGEHHHGQYDPTIGWISKTPKSRLTTSWGDTCRWTRNTRISTWNEPTDT